MMWILFLPGGPKRFRPLTREELENKVIELERKVKKLGAIPSNKPSTPLKNPSTFTPLPSSSSSSKGKENVGEVLTKVGELIEKVEELQRTVEVKDKLLLQSKGEIVRVKGRNSELAYLEVLLEAQKKESAEIQSNYTKIVSDLKSKSLKLVEVEEELSFLKDEVKFYTLGVYFACIYYFTLYLSQYMH